MDVLIHRVATPRTQDALRDYEQRAQVRPGFSDCKPGQQAARDQAAAKIQRCLCLKAMLMKGISKRCCGRAKWLFRLKPGKRCTRSMPDKLTLHAECSAGQRGLGSVPDAQAGALAEHAGAAYCLLHCAHRLLPHPLPPGVSVCTEILYLALGCLCALGSSALHLDVPAPGCRLPSQKFIRCIALPLSNHGFR